MGLTGRRLLSVKLTLVLSTALLAGLLVHVSPSSAHIVTCDSSIEVSVAETGPGDANCGFVDGDGGSLQTESPATSDNPHWTKVTIPRGFSGFIEIDERIQDDTSVDITAVTCDPMSPHYSCLVVGIATTFSTTRTKPMVFRFTYDKSTIPAGKNIQRIRIFHNGQRVPRCDDEDDARIGFQLEQGQESCHAKTYRLSNRDVRIVVLTKVNGSWRPR